MLKNYFKIAWRNLLKDSQSTFLNLIGLATGLAGVLLIFFRVNDELHNKSLGDNEYGGRFPVSGVFKNIPPNSSEHFDLIFNYDFFLLERKIGNAES